MPSPTSNASSRPPTWKGQITYCNDIFAEVSGFARDELIRAPHNPVRHPDVPPAVFEHM